tara:strand:+ start:310 stop:1257 length:948 start_codon:yes stop_codon:yes gene_type:complete
MNRKEVDKQLFDNYKYVVAAFYCFSPLKDENISYLHKELTSISSGHRILGTVILALEGINGSICADLKGVKEFLRVLEKQFNEKIDVKLSPTNKNAFRRFKIKNKDEIVTMRAGNVDPNEQVGNYVRSCQWNDLIVDPDTLVIDTRNKYEISIGTFHGSLNPNTENFSEFPHWIEKELKPYLAKNPKKRIAMFCTGGIRCEKATSFLLQKGFKDIYHLQGGILRYLEIVPREESLWEGDCFVFDQRVSLNHNLLPGKHDLCFACGMPLSQEDRMNPHYIKGVQCDFCKGSFTDKDRLRFAERQKQFDVKSKKITE